MDDTCTWCGATGCDPTNGFHSLLRRHDLHSQGWSDVGEGWLVLVDDLVEDLKDLGWNGTLGQIKEKFGVLRFYADDTDAPMEARIRQAERLSRRVCEVCGAPGELGTVPGSTWLRTRCADHARQPPVDSARRMPAGWFEGLAQGVRPLAPAVQFLLRELGARTASLATMPAPTPSVMESLLPDSPACLLVTVPVALLDAVAVNLLSAWLNLRKPTVAFIACKSRRRCAEQLVAMHADVPLDRLTRFELTKPQRAAVEASTGDLCRTTAIIDDIGRDLDQVIAHLRGIAAAADLGLIVVVGLERYVRFDSPKPPVGDEHENRDEAWGMALARLVVLAEAQPCLLVVLTTVAEVARFAETDASLAMAVRALAVSVAGNAVTIGDLQLRLLPSGRLVASSDPL